MTVYCEDCTHATNRTESVYKWRCLAFKKEPEQTYVKRNAITEPMMKCIDIQRKYKGDCPSFEKTKRIEDVQ